MQLVDFLVNVPMSAKPTLVIQFVLYLVKPILCAVINGYLINVDYTYIKEMNAELSAIGRNINQIAARANSTGIIYADDIAEIKKKQEEIWQLQKSILSNLR